VEYLTTHGFFLPASATGTGQQFNIITSGWRSPLVALLFARPLLQARDSAPIIHTYRPSLVYRSDETTYIDPSC
jgi:hypothetical protein